MQLLEFWCHYQLARGVRARVFKSAICVSFELGARHPEILAIVHDDACHLHKFCEKRADSFAQAARLSPPQIRYICDAFHMAGHNDAWCRVHCSPYAVDLLPLVKDVRTSVCEFTFTWFSQYKYQTKHMNQHGMKFFLLEMCAAHNDCVFAGNTQHLRRW